MTTPLPMPGADGTKPDGVCRTYLLSHNQKYISQYNNEFLLKRDLKSGFVCLIIYRIYGGVKNTRWSMSRIATVGLETVGSAQTPAVEGASIQIVGFSECVCTLSCNSIPKKCTYFS